MTGSWTVLASGSSGNASLLEWNGKSLLLDIGLGPRQFDSRLSEIGFGWDGIEHGQLVGRLTYMPLLSRPDKIYGTEIGSSYQQQALTLSKQFRRPTC